MYSKKVPQLRRPKKVPDKKNQKPHDVQHILSCLLVPVQMFVWSLSKWSRASQVQASKTWRCLFSLFVFFFHLAKRHHTHLLTQNGRKKKKKLTKNIYNIYIHISSCGSNLPTLWVKGFWLSKIHLLRQPLGENEEDICQRWNINNFALNLLVYQELGLQSWISFYLLV